MVEWLIIKYLLWIPASAGMTDRVLCGLLSHARVRVLWFQGTWAERAAAMANLPDLFSLHTAPDLF